MQGLIRTTTLSLTLVATTTWADTHFVAPGQSIQAAVDAAADGDVIELGAGVHVDSVEIFGRDLMFQGQGKDESIWMPSSTNMVDATFSLLHIEGVTLTGGNGVIFDNVAQGGAVLVAGSSSVFVDCKFLENQARGGAAVFTSGGDTYFGNCDFIGNTLTGGINGGQAVLSEFADHIFHNCFFHRNGQNSVALSRGSVEVYGGSVSISNCIFQENFGNQGGAIGAVSASAFISQSTFVNNGSYANYFQNSTANFANCLFSENAGAESSHGVNRIHDSEVQFGGSVVQNQQMLDASVNNIPGLQNVILSEPLMAEGTGLPTPYDLPTIRAVGGTADPMYTDLLNIQFDFLGNPRSLEHRLAGAIESNTPAPESCDADLDQSGKVDYLDLVMVLAAWGVSEQQNDEDLDHDGFVDLQDLTHLLSSWGPCS